MRRVPPPLRSSWSRLSLIMTLKISACKQCSPIDTWAQSSDGGILPPLSSSLWLLVFSDTFLFIFPFTLAPKLLLPPNIDLVGFDWSRTVIQRSRTRCHYCTNIFMYKVNTPLALSLVSERFCIDWSSLLWPCHVIHWPSAPRGKTLHVLHRYSQLRQFEGNVSQELYDCIWMLLKEEALNLMYWDLHFVWARISMLGRDDGSSLKFLSTDTLSISHSHIP